MKYAQVLANVAFMHTDHPYDYTIPERFQSQLEVGMRVKINFGGRKLLGFVVGIKNATEHKAAGEILEVLDAFAVMKPEVEVFCSELARRYLTARSQVMNFALPSPTKKVNEKLMSEIPEALPQFSNINNSSVPIQSTSVLLSPTIKILDWSLEKIKEFLGLGKQGIVLIPNYALLHQVVSAIKRSVPEIRIGVLSADMTPSQRYEQFMRIWRNEVHLVVGTRSAVFAPLSALDFVLILHENDDSYVEQQSGNWHVRDAAIIRCALAKSPFLAVGYTRSVELEQRIQMGLIESQSVEGKRSVKTVIVPKDDTENIKKLRLPSVAFNVIRQGLLAGPVLLQVPMRGYQLNIQCARCREKAACEECGGGLEVVRNQNVHCTRCGQSFGQFRCQWCSHSQVRAITIGAVRTAEEIGKAFPRVPIYTSGRNSILVEIENQPCLVIATPGAEPQVADGSYAAIVILDPEITLNRIDLRAHEEAFRRWYNLKALANPDGVQLICTQELHPIIRYLMNDDPSGFAKSQLLERTAAQLPPATECYLIEGDYDNIVSTIEEVSDFQGVIVLGPAQHKRGTYALLQTQHNDNTLNISLRAILARRSSSKAKGTLRVRYSPQVLP